MDIEKLIEQLKNAAGGPEGIKMCQDASTALSTLQAENDKLQVENSMLRKMQPVELDGEATQSLSLALEVSELKSDLNRVTAERDAAVSDVTAILADVEEIRMGYGVDNEDADGAFADLCVNYCAKRGNDCYKEGEKYCCKNFEWRGIKED